MSSRNASIDLPSIPPSVTVSRHLVLELLRSWRVPHDREDAALLVTELVSNVVDHVGGQTTLTLELAVSEDWLRIAVVDGSPARPVVQEPSLDHPRGRGFGWSSSSPTAGGPRTIAAGSGCGSNCGRPAGEPAGGLPRTAIGDRLLDVLFATERNRVMSEPTGDVHGAGEGISDEEMVETVAGQTDSASENADTAGKDWDGDPSEAPAPTDQA
ncbi:ATP-binding protein [Blastococcus brunescens]|uniref:ATP-binding protein n=1 Tax=Blastococcus brunescens TaxID=1564165 RepID=A0ABZ1B005_9ACTN|nr:ATP-binding protein [Blastococcus sp. BMG 8361]WRL63243.1 ATP-binding protein [Blastococcus sp. BMG 8361]